MGSEYRKHVHRQIQYMMIICLVLVFGMAGVVAACVALDRQLEVAAKVDQENVKW